MEQDNIEYVAQQIEMDNLLMDLCLGNKSDIPAELRSLLIEILKLNGLI